MNQYAQEIRQILASLDHVEDEADTPTSPQPEPPEPEVIHVYPTADGGILFSPTELEPEEPYILECQEQPLHEDVTVFLLPACVVVLLGLIFFSLLLPTPIHEVSFTVSVPSVPLPSVTKVEKVTVNATGKGQTPATTATGTITFYNGAIYTQIIPIGTILTGADGIQVITDAEAVIPPVAKTTPPTDGSTNVPAHSLVAGASGNMQAGDINMACCVTSVIAQNPYTFTGGRDAQKYTYLTAQDVKHATFALEQGLQTQTIALFPSPRVLDPTCTTTQSTPQVGQTTQSAEVTISEACHALSYRLSAVKTAITFYSKRVGMGTLSTIQFQIIEVHARTITLYVTGTWTPIIVRPYPAER